MTQYSIAGSAVSIRAGATFDVRLIRVDYQLYNFGAISATVNKVVSPSGYSGGTVLTAYPTREGPGAPTAGATCRDGASVTGGTPARLHYSSNVGVDQAAQPAQTENNNSFTPPTDIILRAGSSSVIAVVLTGNNFAAQLYFEELRLFWSL